MYPPFIWENPRGWVNSSCGSSRISLIGGDELLMMFSERGSSEISQNQLPINTQSDAVTTKNVVPYTLKKVADQKNAVQKIRTIVTEFCQASQKSRTVDTGFCVTFLGHSHSFSRFSLPLLASAFFKVFTHFVVCAEGHFCREHTPLSGASRAPGRHTSFWESPGNSGRLGSSASWFKTLDSLILLKNKYQYLYST